MHSPGWFIVVVSQCAQNNDVIISSTIFGTYLIHQRSLHEKSGVLEATPMLVKPRSPLMITLYLLVCKCCFHIRNFSWSVLFTELFIIYFQTVSKQSQGIQMQGLVTIAEQLLFGFRNFFKPNFIVSTNQKGNFFIQSWKKNQ